MAFAALLDRLLASDKVGICLWTRRTNTPPRFVALVPQVTLHPRHPFLNNPPPLPSCSSCRVRACANKSRLADEAIHTYIHTHTPLTYMKICIGRRSRRRRAAGQSPWLPPGPAALLRRHQGDPYRAAATGYPALHLATDRPPTAALQRAGLPCGTAVRMGTQVRAVSLLARVACHAPQCRPSK